MSELPDYVCKLEADNERLYNETITLKQHRDALLEACKAVWDDTKGLSPSDYVKLDTFQKIKAAIALAEK